MHEISLALGGGGMKGIAHIGVFKSLEDSRFKIRAISGTSAGGLIGALYSSGYSVSKIIEIVSHVNQKHLFQRGKNDGPALLGLVGLTDTLTQLLGDRQFSDLPIPFACTSVDLYSGQEIILNRGSVVDAVLATIAIPGAFPPRIIDNHTLVDGGILDPVPVALARWMAPRHPVVAVVLSSQLDNEVEIQPVQIPINVPIPKPIVERIAKLRISQAIRIFIESFDISTRKLSELRLIQDKPDVVIRPELSEFGILDEVDPETLIRRGEIAANEAVPKVISACSWRNLFPKYIQKITPPGKFILSNNDPKSD